MAHVPQTILNKTWLLPLALGLPILCGLAGCLGMSSSVVAKREQAPAGLPTQVVMTWEPRVLITADTARNGAPLPGLAGRLYLFGDDCGVPMAHDGSVHVELFDAAPAANGGQPVMIETWDIGADKMKLLLRKDIIGWGYTLFLPWGTYKPTTTHVHLKVCFTTTAGNTLYSPSSPLRLMDSNCPPPMVTQTTHVHPAAPPTPADPTQNPLQMLPPKN